MLEIERTCLVVVDVQGKLAELMFDKQELFKNIEILIRGAKILEMPIIWCQQNPRALGETIDQLKTLLEDDIPVDKFSFSCCDDEAFAERLKAANCKHVILCGIEAHICIYQTAMDLLDHEYDVHVIADAISSRTEKNKQTAIRRIEWEGAAIGTTEMALFELLSTAKHEKFRDIARLVK